MKVLITGGMGVIGAMTTRKFVKEGHRPVVMARHMDKNLIGPIEDKIDVELADVQDFPRIISIRITRLPTSFTRQHSSGLYRTKIHLRACT
jgi:NADP-dependent 3-hydroxy acid dehydrogenase YdfG